MKKKHVYSLLLLIPIIAFISLSFKTGRKKNADNCMMAVTYSEMAMGQFKKAYKAKTIEVAKPALKKGIGSNKAGFRLCSTV